MLKSVSVNKSKYLNDPIYGLISITNPFIFKLIGHPYFQRLRRISQIGLSHLVYPGANHTRFSHAIGCIHLMHKAISVLRLKNIEISAAEEEAVTAAILFHDIGHGPFSHALEHSIVSNLLHEKISLQFMENLNKLYEGQLDMAIAIFKGTYHRKFFNQLISSQLDIDRLDYLKRDCFYAGVPEGSINSERLISMLNVKNNELVLEEKAIYSLEKFIIARRLMYWQVYLHKTSIVAEQILVHLLKRAKLLSDQNIKLPCTKALFYFLTNHNVAHIEERSDFLETFAKLDDSDILSAIKQWMDVDDFILSTLSKMIVNRDLLKIKLQKEPFTESEIDGFKEKAMQVGYAKDDLKYFVYTGSIANQAYNDDSHKIQLVNREGEAIDLVATSDQLNLQALSVPVIKYYICYPEG